MVYLMESRCNMPDMGDGKTWPGSDLAALESNVESPVCSGTYPDHSEACIALQKTLLYVPMWKLNTSLADMELYTVCQHYP